MLVGDACTLAVQSPEDAPAWQAGNDAEIIRWFEFPGTPPLTEVRAAIDTWRESWALGGPVRHWGIWVAGRLAGGVELRDRGDRRANLYVVFAGFRRRGIGADAVCHATHWGLEHLPVDAIVAIVDWNNVASRALAERAGFVLEGLAERWEYDESGPAVRYVYDGLPRK